MMTHWDKSNETEHECKNRLEFNAVSEGYVPADYTEFSLSADKKRSVRLWFVERTGKFDI